MSNTFTSRSSYQRTTGAPRRRTEGPSAESPTRVGRRNTARREMNYQGQRQGYNIDSGLNTDETARSSAAGQQTSQDRSGQYAGGYTVFPPNERRRQQINMMAQRETRAYEEHKQSNAAKCFSYVGTVGGGQLTENQARTRQANAVRAQKFNRREQQKERRESLKRREEQEIQKKRSEASRKAEQNAERESRIPPAAEVRRNREAFLRQVENRTSMQGLPAQKKSQTTGSAPFRHTPADRSMF